jgi:hypothetical protein
VSGCGLYLQPAITQDRGCTCSLQRKMNSPRPSLPYRPPQSVPGPKSSLPPKNAPSSHHPIHTCTFVLLHSYTSSSITPFFSPAQFDSFSLFRTLFHSCRNKSCICTLIRKIPQGYPSSPPNAHYSSYSSAVLDARPTTRKRTLNGLCSLLTDRSDLRSHGFYGPSAVRPERHAFGINPLAIRPHNLASLRHRSP